MLSFFVQAGSKSHVYSAYERPTGVINMIPDYHLGSGDTYPRASTAISCTRSCTILVIWETDRWSAGSNSQPRLEKFMLTSTT